MPDRGPAQKQPRQGTRTTMVPTNQVQLQGRLAASPERRSLPSGDEVVTFRLVVARRSTARSPGGARPAVDTIDCTIWSAGLRRRSTSWQAGEVLAVGGALRRRFWRSGGGPRSRYDVEVTTVTRVRGAVP